MRAIHAAIAERMRWMAEGLPVAAFKTERERSLPTGVFLGLMHLLKIRRKTSHSTAEFQQIAASKVVKQLKCTLHPLQQILSLAIISSVPKRARFPFATAH
jgi:hypothetical protein